MCVDGLLAPLEAGGEEEVSIEEEETEVEPLKIAKGLATSQRRRGGTARVSPHPVPGIVQMVRYGSIDA